MQDRPGQIGRRGVALGLAGLAASALARPVMAQETLTDTAPAALLTNLITRVAAMARLNGVHGFRLVLDTGAGRTALASDVAERLRLPAGPPVLVHGVTAAQTAPTVHLARLQFGGRRFDDLVAPVFPRNLLGADGLLGLDVLGRFRIGFDLAERSVTLVPSGRDVTPVGFASVTPSRLSELRDRQVRRTALGQLILSNAEADGVPADIFVDSGAQYSIGSLALLRAIGGDAGGLNSVRIYGVVGQSLEATAHSVRELRLAGRPLGPTPLLFADLHAFRILGLADRPALLVGADLLQRFRRVTLDFGRSRMSFGPLRRVRS